MLENKESLENAPVAVFVYNRLEHTKRLIESLKKNKEATDSDLYIFSDAPKETGDEERRKLAALKVADVRDYIESIDGFKRVTIVKREMNYGLAKNITAGITEVLATHPTVIVLEDDLIVSEALLYYMNSALNKYADSENVYSISGYSFIKKNENTGEVNDTYFLPMTCSWGWATWRDKWECYDAKAKGWEILKSDKKEKEKFNFGNSIDYYSMLKAQMEKGIDSWAIRWYWSVYQRSGLTLYPSLSYIANGGFDGSGVHTIGETPGGKRLELSDSANITFPKDYHIDSNICGAVQNSIMGIEHNTIKDQINRIIKKNMIKLGISL